MKKVYFLLALILGVILISGCTLLNQNSQNQNQPLDNEPVVEIDGEPTESCVAQESGIGMSLEEALAIANDSECVQKGAVKEDCNCNEGTGTCWLDMEVEGHEGCNPACVVNVETGEAEINWRCTGLIAE